MSDASSPSTVVMSFAVPDESRLFTAGLENRAILRARSRHPLPTICGELDRKPVVVVHTGIGDSSGSREHLARLFAGLNPPPRAVISAGYAGALDPGLAVGDLILGENHSSPALLETARVCLAGQATRAGTLLTEPEALETARQKAALHDATGAIAVDMETAWIAESCKAAGFPMLSLRVISDAANQDFPVPGRVLYDPVRQRPRYLALPAWLALHPRSIGPFVRFVRGLGPARENLTRALRIVLAAI